MKLTREALEGMLKDLCDKGRDIEHEARDIVNNGSTKDFWTQKDKAQKMIRDILDEVFPD
jgi:hypothetical protein